MERESIGTYASSVFSAEGDDRVDVQLRVEEVRRDTISVEPLLRHDLELNAVHVVHGGVAP